MSLKARIEAVIYAAEEPVTLAQLAALFDAEALEQKQAREEALAAEAAALAEADAQQAEEVVAAPAPAQEGEAAQDAAAEAEPPTAEGEPTAEAAPTGETSDETDSSGPEESSAEPSADAAEDVAPEAELSPEAEAAAAAAEEKRLARQRERDIRDELRLTLDELIVDYESSNRGMEIREIAGGYRVGTKPEYHDAVRAFVKGLKPPIKLSLQALETLAVVAYKQPITAPEISEIRGVDSSGVLGSLISRKLINTAGRKQVIGRPILYKTTKEFLLRFGLKDLSELPSMEEFEKMAGELNDNEEEPAESENLPFSEQESGEAAAEEGDAAAAVPAVTAEELAWRAEHGAPAASIPSVIQITVESESEILEDLPGVEIDAEALENGPEAEPEAAAHDESAEAAVEEPSEKQ